MCTFVLLGGAPVCCKSGVQGIHSLATGTTPFSLVPPWHRCRATPTLAHLHLKQTVQLGTLKRCLRDIAGFPCRSIESTDRGPRCVTTGPPELVHKDYQEGVLQDPSQWFDLKHAVYVPNTTRFREPTEQEQADFDRALGEAHVSELETSRAVEYLREDTLLVEHCPTHLEPS